MKKLTCLLLCLIMCPASVNVFGFESTVGEQYKTVYGEGEYIEGSIPDGEYVLFAEEGKVGRYILKTRESGEKDIPLAFSYNHIVNINSSMYFELVNCYAVPSNEVKQLDLTQNGMFRCGVDIPVGEYTFKRDDNSDFGLVYYYDSNGNIRKIAEFWDDSPEFAKNVTLGINTNIYKLNCDIYKENTLVYDYSPLNYGNGSLDEGYSYENVSPRLKSKISADIKLIADNFYPTKLTGSDKFSNKYYNSVKNVWAGYVENKDDEKYLEIVTGALDNLYEYCNSIRNDTYQNKIGYGYYCEIINKKTYKKEIKELYDAVNNALVNLRYGQNFSDLNIRAGVLKDYINVL